MFAGMEINRRTLLAAPFAATTSGCAAAPGGRSVEFIPVIWAPPQTQTRPAKLVIWLSGGISPKEETIPQLEDLARAGFVAVSFDSYHRGSRSPESADEYFGRVFDNFPNIMWPVLANSAMEVLRVIDWAAAEFGAEPPFYAGGYSMGGDIATGAAGLDPRIGCVATVGSTPDWRRPGARAGLIVVGPGAPDAYARHLYAHVDPYSNLSRFAHRPAITFECGAQDDHVPPSGALRFTEALAATYAEQPERLRVTLHEGSGHEFTSRKWRNCLDWFVRFSRGR
jgi:dienelactone hydrolase